MKQAVSIINVVKNPFNLSVLVILILGSAYVSSGDTETSKWALLFGVIFVWLVVMISDYFKEKRLVTSEDSTETVNNLKKEIDDLKSVLTKLEADIEDKNKKISEFESEALTSEVRTYFSPSDDFTVDEAVEKFISKSENKLREQTFRSIVGQMEKSGELYNYTGKGKLRLK